MQSNSADFRMVYRSPYIPAFIGMFGIFYGITVLQEQIIYTGRPLYIGVVFGGLWLLTPVATQCFIYLRRHRSGVRSLPPVLLICLGMTGLMFEAVLMIDPNFANVRDDFGAQFVAGYRSEQVMGEIKNSSGSVVTTYQTTIYQVDNAISSMALKTAVAGLKALSLFVPVLLMLMIAMATKDSWARRDENLGMAADWMEEKLLVKKFWLIYTALIILVCVPLLLLMLTHW